MNEQNTILQEKFLSYFQSLNQDEIRSFLSNPKDELEKIGIPLVADFNTTSKELELVSFDKDVNLSSAIAASSDSVTFDVCWWGIDIIFDNDITEQIISGGMEISTLTSLIAGAAGGTPLAAVAGIIALAIYAKAWHIKIINEGDGVHIPLTWLQIPMINAAFLFPIFAN